MSSTSNCSSQLTAPTAPLVPAANPYPALLGAEERVRALIAQGESQFREFKSAVQGGPRSTTPRDPRSIRRDVGEALVAFANADGGQLLVGVEDDGEITGVPHSDSQIQSFVHAPHGNVHPATPLPAPRVSRVTINGRLILLFSVDKSLEMIHLTSDGKCLVRRDRASVPNPTEQIRFERAEQRSREYDRVFVDGARVEHLNGELLEAVGNEVASGFSPEKVLQLLDLAEFDGVQLRLRRGAMLLFASDVGRWHPRCQVRVMRVDGTEVLTGADYNVREDKTVIGPILRLVVDAWEALRPYLVTTRFASDGRFVMQGLYPEEACREALLNAIAHRDYSDEGVGIEVLVYDDRMVIRSPGALLANITVDELVKLDGVHQSRNTKSLACCAR